MAHPPSPLSPAARSVVVGTAGHIDHGKTALVQALTGIDTDRLPEEKRRGITIDLGFASLETRAADGSALRLSFVDVPGHAKFVRNMLAGAGGIDAVLMVISAEEGVMPQTEEHLAICSLLGMERGITVLTKADAVSHDHLQETKGAVKRYLRDTFLASAPVLAVSARSGFGIPELRQELVRVAERSPGRRSDTALRLPIDRSFVMKGFGTVVTGTLIGGSIRVGDELEIQPGDRMTRVRSLQVHGHPEEEACAGSRVALNLTRVEAAELRRGDILVRPSSVPAVDWFDAELTLLPGASAMKHRARVHFHAFASECMATATLYEATAIGPGETGMGRLRLSAPAALLPHDRFVLRTGTPITTMGGGRVLDVHPSAHRNKKAAEWLHRLRTASPEEAIRLRIAGRGVSGISRKELSRETGITEAAIDRLLEVWIREGLVHSAADKRFLTPEAFSAARQTILQRLRGSMRRSELREHTGLPVDVFDDALRGMELEYQLQLSGDLVATSVSPDHHSQDSRIISVIAREYELAGVTPPSTDELTVRLGIAPAAMRRFITLLIREKTLVRLGDDTLCMHRRVLEDLTERIRSLHGQTMEIAAFKQLAGVSRKYAIPLLEYFDRARVTRKQGNQRLVL